MNKNGLFVFCVLLSLCSLGGTTSIHNTFLVTQTGTVTTTSKIVNERTSLTFNNIPIKKGSLKSGDCIAFEMVGSHWPGEWAPFKDINPVSVRNL
jgi:hypothetical protein